MKRLPIDFEDLCIALDRTPGDMRWYLDSSTGKMILVNREYDPDETEGPSLDDIEAHPERYLAVPEANSTESDMRDFIVSLDDPRLKESLEISMTGPRPERRFRNVLEHVPEQRQLWLSFKQSRLHQRARSWLATHGIEPASPRS